MSDFYPLTLKANHAENQRPLTTFGQRYFVIALSIGTAASFGFRVKNINPYKDITLLIFDVPRIGLRNSI